MTTPHHSASILILTHTPCHGTSTTTSYHSGTPTATPVKQRKRCSITSLPQIDRTIILHPSTITRNQYILLILMSHIFLTTPNPRTIQWTPLTVPSTGPNIIRPILATLTPKRHRICGMPALLPLLHDIITYHTFTIQIKYHRSQT